MYASLCQVVSSPSIGLTVATILKGNAAIALAIIIMNYVMHCLVNCICPLNLLFNMI